MSRVHQPRRTLRHTKVRIPKGFLRVTSCPPSYASWLIRTPACPNALSVFLLAGVLWRDFGKRFRKEEPCMLNRRSFLSSSFASSLAVGAGLAWRGNLWAQLESLPSKLPARSL